MRLNIYEIRDYLRCPLYYRFKHVDELPYNKSIDDLFTDNLKTSIYYYYFSIIERKEKSFESILRKWENLWFSRPITETFSEGELKEYSNKAVMTLTSYYNKISDENVTPIAVNFPYDAMFKESNLQVTGSIDIIKILNDRTRNSSTEIIFLSTSKSKQREFLLKNDISLTMASYAFRKSFKSKEDKVCVNNISIKDDVYTTRTSSDFSRAEKIINNVSKGIEQGIYYPSPNAVNCSHCRYKLFCLNERAI